MPQTASLSHLADSPPLEIIRSEPAEPVGTSLVVGRTDPLSRYSQPMTAACREHAIYIAGKLMERSYANYAKNGCPDELDRAYYHLGQMKDLIAGRDAETVVRLERERGLA